MTGQTKVNLTELSKQHNIPYSTLQSRVFRGMKPEDAVKKGSITAFGSEEIPKNNTTGVRNVSWDSNKQMYVGQFQCKKKVYYCGTFASIEDTLEAVREKKEELKQFGD